MTDHHCASNDKGPAGGGEAAMGQAAMGQAGMAGGQGGAPGGGEGHHGGQGAQGPGMAHGMGPGGAEAMQAAAMGGVGPVNGPPHGMAGPAMGYPPGGPWYAMPGYAMPGMAMDPRAMAHAAHGGMPPGYYGAPPQGMAHGMAHGMPGHANPGMGTPPGAGPGPGAGRGPGMTEVMNEIANGGNGLSSLSKMLDLDDSEFWKGALVGAAAVLLLTNESVQNALFKTGVKAKDAVEEGVSKVKAKAAAAPEQGDA